MSEKVKEKIGGCPTNERIHDTSSPNLKLYDREPKNERGGTGMHLKGSNERVVEGSLGTKFQDPGREM